jgi:glycosyltransferase involved in cell wall biosynthesis
VVLTSVLALARYLRSLRPQGLIAGGNDPNFTAVVGRAVARVSIPVIVSHQANLSLEAQGKPSLRWVARFIYPWADGIVAVSQGVADDLSRVAHLPAQRITTIHNPAVRPEIQTKAREPLSHSWFAPGEPPVVLGVGRLHRQKDFPTLVRAFAHLRKVRKARLVILGMAKKPERRTALIELAAELGVADDMALPGYVNNPFAYMARASVFALSSAWEGLPTVLIEAMACGCPVVSTDCPNGPCEILEGGKYGPLVPVGDAAALAQAVLSVLDAPPDPEQLRTRAADFSADTAVDRYLEVLRGWRSSGRLSG